jgi:MFS transporter, UMF1 family
VVAWLLWYCGSTGLSAIVVSFVFSVYLTGRVGEGMPGGSSPASWLGRAQALAGLAIALLAPLIGVWVADATAAAGPDGADRPRGRADQRDGPDS